MENIVIFGDTKFAERLYSYISIETCVNVIAFTQERGYISRETICGIPVIPFENLSTLSCDFKIILGIGYSGMNTLKEKVYKLCKECGYDIATYISRSAIVYTDKIGEGTFISPGAIVGPGSELGIGNFMESGAVLSHDNVLGHFNFLSTNSVFGGFTKVSNYCFFGLNSTIKDGLHITDYTLVGSAANVLKSVDIVASVLVGNPARILEQKISTAISL